MGHAEQTRHGASACRCAPAALGFTTAHFDAGVNPNIHPNAATNQRYDGPGIRDSTTDDANPNNA